VHADLLLNHLVADDDSIATVFDWGNAMAGDPLYDIAWILCCLPWFPTIERRQVVGLAHRHFPSGDVDRLLPLYELHVNVAAMQYLAYADEDTGLQTAAEQVDTILSTLNM
jgi:hygromycin-B 4-O-kinase